MWKVKLTMCWLTTILQLMILISFLSFWYSHFGWLIGHPYGTSIFTFPFDPVLPCRASLRSSLWDFYLSRFLLPQAFHSGRCLKRLYLDIDYSLLNIRPGIVLAGWQVSPVAIGNLYLFFEIGRARWPAPTCNALYYISRIRNRISNIEHPKSNIYF